MNPLHLLNFLSINFKRNNRTAEDEIHLNKRTRLEEPNAVDFNFDIQEQPRQDDIKPGLTNVTSVVAGETNIRK